MWKLAFGQHSYYNIGLHIYNPSEGALHWPFLWMGTGVSIAAILDFFLLLAKTGGWIDFFLVPMWGGLTHHMITISVDHMLNFILKQQKSPVCHVCAVFWWIEIDNAENWLKTSDFDCQYLEFEARLYLNVKSTFR